MLEMILELVLMILRIAKAVIELVKLSKCRATFSEMLKRVIPQFLRPHYLSSFFMKSLISIPVMMFIPLGRSEIGNHLISSDSQFQFLS